jgi:phage terminase Nu1 subunit (DNA packaging protein)
MSTQNEIALHLDLSARSVRDLQAAGLFRLGASLDEARTAYIRKLREEAAGRSTSNGLNLANERALLARAQTEKTELEIAVKKEELISLAEAERGWCSLVGAFRAKMLILPSRASIAVLNRSEKEAERILTDMVYEALAELSNWKPDDDEEAE